MFLHQVRGAGSAGGGAGGEHELSKSLAILSVDFVLYYGSIEARIADLKLDLTF